MPDMVHCLDRHPEISDFNANCASPHSPEAFVYTTDYPAQADLAIVHVFRSPSGVNARVRNGGRHGKITSLECHAIGRHIVRAHDVALAPGETTTVTVSNPFSPGQRVTCTVFGANEDGTPEPTTCVDGVCGNNTRVATL
ncbi:uncharacterized protein SOCE26_003510 [Sorangium cellulosum]|uniref:Uncharacterized protein n=2 Tax=Sorangium cellulosum TaxID=56 RepID=A0A2L0EI53_SORCE|nr:uncharacterized protein SOCE26_003510 [Sorangium cellulosum]